MRKRERSHLLGKRKKKIRKVNRDLNKKRREKEMLKKERKKITNFEGV